MLHDLSGLPSLLAVADQRSFTAAAMRLQVTPSAVSQAVRALEERLGVRLVQRTTRSVGLTEAGERLVAQLRPALESVNESLDSLSDQRDVPAGTLRLEVPRVAYHRVLRPHLPGFLAAHPRIRVEVRVDDGFSNIVESGCDAGIRIGEMLDRDMIAVKIGGNETSAVVGAPGYFAARGKPKHPRELQQHDCITYRRVRRGDIYRWEFTVDGKDIEIAVDGRVVINDGEAMITAALDGLGLANTLESTVREHIAKGRLQRVLASYCPPFPGLFLYYPSRAQLAPKLAAFIAYLTKRVHLRARTH
ncbi:MAG: LysR family transcriptional regulator [Kofleriaceae bacterium]